MRKPQCMIANYPENCLDLIYGNGQKKTIAFETKEGSESMSEFVRELSLFLEQFIIKPERLLTQVLTLCSQNLEQQVGTISDEILGARMRQILIVKEFGLKLMTQENADDHGSTTED